MGDKEESQAINNSSAEETRPLIEHEGKEKLSLLYKILRIVNLFWIWLCIGCYSEITGPVLPELIVQTGSTYDIVARSVSMRGAGHALGGIIGGLTVDRWFSYIDALISVVLFLYTAVSVGAAYVQNIDLLFAVLLAQGTLETWLQIGGNRIALKTWEKKASGPLQAVNIGYSLGSIIVPQLVAPFLDPRFSSGAIHTGYNSSCRANETSHYSSTTVLSTSLKLTNQDSVSSVTTATASVTPEYPAHFVIPYWILSGLGIAMSLVFLIYHIHGRMTGIRIDVNVQKQESSKSSNFKKSISPSSCSPTKPVYGVLIISTLFFYYIISVPLNRVFSKFIFSYARDGPCLSVTESTSLESAFFAASAIGRLCAFLSSSVIHIKYILQVDILAVLGSCLVLFFFYNNITVLWIACCALGFFTGPIIPSAFAWANHYIEVTSVAQIIPQIGAAVGDVVFLSLVGYSYQNFGPYTLWSYQLALGASICVTMWILQIFGTLHGDRYQK